MGGDQRIAVGYPIYTSSKQYLEKVYLGVVPLCDIVYVAILYDKWLHGFMP